MMATNNSDDTRIHALVPLTITNTEKLARACVRAANRIVDEEVIFADSDNGSGLEQVTGQIATAMMTALLTASLHYGIDEQALDDYLALPKAEESE